MKKSKNLFSLSTLAIASLFAITGCANIDTLAKGADGLIEYAEDVDTNEKISLRSLQKLSRKSLTNEDYSKTFVQRGTKGDKKYIRFATAVALGDETSIADLKYVREEIDAEHPQIEKEVTTVYKSIQGEGDSYWYFDASEKQLTTEVQDNDFYFACFTIEISNENLYLGADISAYLKINESSYSVSVEASYDALANGSNVVSYYDGTSLLKRHVVATNADINGDYVPSKTDYNFLGFASSNGGQVIETLPPVTGDVSYYAVFEHNHELHHHDGKAPTCEEAGWDPYDTCDCGYTTYHELPATDHNYLPATYKWDGNVCTGTIVCQNDSDHNIVRIATGNFVEDTPATCDEPQKGHYVATFDDERFTQQSTPVNSAIGDPAKEHDYSIKYTWNGDKCVAERICANNEDHYTSEEGTVTFVEDTPATCESAQLGHYLAKFENEIFEDQVTAANSVTGDGALGHSYGNPTYIWNGANCTATVTCTRCSDEISETATYPEQVEIVLDNVSQKTGHYEATFNNSLFKKQCTEQNSVDTRKTYTISFVTGSTEQVNDISLKEGETVDVALLPTLVDRNDANAPRFVCWTLNSVDVTSDFAMPEENITLVAKWRALEKWTIKFDTGINGVTLNDVVISEDEGLNSFVAPSFAAEYKIFDGWCYDVQLTQDLGTTLDANKFVNHELTLYAKTTATDVSNPSTWTNENGVYSGIGFTQVNSVVALNGTQISLDIEFPAFDKQNPFGETYIYFGGDSQLWTDKGAVSGYFLAIHGANAGANDDMGGVKAPRSGSYQLFKAAPTGNTQLVAGRRYAAPFDGSEYMNAYNAYIDSGNTLTVNVKFVLCGNSSYVEIMGTKLNCVLDYQPTDGSFGFMTGVVDSGGGLPTRFSKIKNLSVTALKTRVNLDAGANANISTSTIDVPYGSSIGELPTPTKEGFTFKSWQYNGNDVDSTFVPQFGSSITLTAVYDEDFVTWDGSSSVEPEGAGTQANPYLIASGANLNYVATKANENNSGYLTAYYKVTSGIDLNGKAYTPISDNRGRAFKGVFDGCDHTIKNAVITGANYRGLFGFLSDAEVRNVKFNANINTTNIICGGIAGGMYMSVIENCEFSGTFACQQSKSGGIVGFVSNPNSTTGTTHTFSAIRNCVNKAAITMTNSIASNNGGIVGGVVGYINGQFGTSATFVAENQSFVIENCVNEGTVSGGTCTGGVVGRIDEPVAASISGCINKANLSSEDYLGGVISFLRKNAASTITNCYNYGNLVSSTVHVGGVMGLNRGTASELYCANNVKINGTTVSASLPVGTNGAICFSNDKANGGSILSWHLCNPL